LLNKVYYANILLLCCLRSRVDIVKPDISDCVFFVGCQNRDTDMFTGYLQDVRIYAQLLDFV